MRQVKPREKQKIIQVSVDRLYSEAPPRQPDYYDRPEYSSNTQRYAEEQFMNSLRSENQNHWATTNSKSGSKLHHSPSRLSNNSSSKASYKPKSGQLRYGLPERQKKKFVKKVANSGGSVFHTPVSLKRAETSKDVGNPYRRNDYSSKDTIPEGRHPHAQVRMVVNSSTVSAKVLTPERYFLQQDNKGKFEKGYSSKKWQFDEDRDIQPSRDKLRLVESEIIQRSPVTQPMSRVTSRVSVKTPIESQSRTKLEKVKSSEKIIHGKSPSSSTLAGKTLDNSRSRSHTKLKKSKTEVAKTKKTISKKLTDQSDSGEKKPIKTKLPIKAEPNPGSDKEGSLVDPLVCFTPSFDHIKPVKPSNYMPSADLPELLAEALTQLRPIGPTPGTFNQDPDEPARKELSSASLEDQLKGLKQAPVASGPVRESEVAEGAGGNIHIDAGSAVKDVSIDDVSDMYDSCDDDDINKKVLEAAGLQEEANLATDDHLDVYSFVYAD